RRGDLEPAFITLWQFVSSTPSTLRNQHQPVTMSETKNNVDTVYPDNPINDDGEESDDYNDPEDEEEEGGDEDGSFEEDDGEDEEDEEGAGPSAQGSSLTAMLLAGSADAGDSDDSESDDEDEDFAPLAPGTHTAPVLTASTSESSMAGTKRSRDDTGEADGEGDLAGDYGEVNENSETVKKKARAAAEPSAQEGEEEV
ncbi:hypothetical protein BXZ70DRAFT_1033940, partial [Cristinia sonorae]